jgi:hypothetical protein
MNDSAVNDGFTRTLINANVMQIKSVCDFCQTEMIGSIAEVLDAREAAHKWDCRSQEALLNLLMSPTPPGAN